MLKENESLEDLMIDGLKIIQNKNLYRFSSDAIALSRFAPRVYGQVADFCAGSGIVGLHYLALMGVESDISVDEYELQSSLADMCKRSIEYNNLCEKVKCYNMAVQDIPSEMNGKYSLVLCNPPYKKRDSGEKNPDDHIALCRHEIAITMEEIIAISALKLKRGGKLCICQRTERLTDLLLEMRKNGLEPTRLQLVTSGKNKKPYLILAEGTKGVKPQLKILPSYEN